MNEEYILLEICTIDGKLSLLNSWVKKIDKTNLQLMKAHVDRKINLELGGECDIRDTNTYKEVFDSNCMIDWEYYRYVVNEEGDSLCVGIIK